MLKPTAHLTIDPTKVDPVKLEILEGVIHGTEHSEPRLPMPWEVYDLLANDPTLGIHSVPDYPDNNLMERGSYYADNSPVQTITNSGDRHELTGESIWYCVKKTSSTPPVLLVASRIMNPGESLTLSIYVRGNSNNSEGVINLMLYSESEGALSHNYLPSTISEWTRLTASYTRPMDKDPISVYTNFYPALAAGSETLFTSPKLEYGPVATPWPPTPYSVSGYNQVNYATGHDLRGYKDEGIYRLHEHTNLKEQGVGLYGL